MLFKVRFPNAPIGGPLQHSSPPPFPPPGEQSPGFELKIPLACETVPAELYKGYMSEKTAWQVFTSQRFRGHREPYSTFICLASFHLATISGAPRALQHVHLSGNFSHRNDFGGTESLTARSFV